MTALGHTPLPPTNTQHDVIMNVTHETYHSIPPLVYATLMPAELFIGSNGYCNKTSIQHSLYHYIAFITAKSFSRFPNW